MRSQIEEAKARLQGDGGLAVRDIGIFPGSDQDATPEAIAGQILRVLDQLERGDY
ncbi:hypothetical protein PQI07_27335 [Methylobacterium sp. 092160098-2]|uniref:hypothetical protein n=1 Tax=Methylobacterium sp. 092160098-2 TaxID=3025129 RepID=UPI002381CF9C|nr:hypothetical protein [Methylobacterium sp. 092160098-2]MDE4914388.1 hypothetical protein [Methylobacterium sp. 092160098-2]